MEGVEEVEGGAEVEEGEGSNILTSYVGIPPPPPYAYISGPVCILQSMKLDIEN